jgi:hypothetical protein
MFYPSRFSHTLRGGGICFFGGRDGCYSHSRHLQARSKPTGSNLLCLLPYGPCVAGLPVPEAPVCKRARRYGVSSPSLFREEESSWFSSRPFATRMGRTPWDRTTAAAVSSRSHFSVLKVAVGKRVRVSPKLAPRVETSVNSANVMEENSIAIFVLSHDIFNIQV